MGQDGDGEWNGRSLVVSDEEKERERETFGDPKTQERQTEGKTAQNTYQYLGRPSR